LEKEAGGKDRQNELIKTSIFPEDVANTVAFLLSNESRNTPDLFLI